MTLTAVSLFAGVGGIDLALESAGVKVAAAVEIDKAARGVLADRFPKTALFTDVTKVTADELRAAGFVPERGILAAGWPCQGNSVAGRRGGMADPRSGLWRHVVRLLAETRPRWFLGENVPGLLSVNDGDDLAVVRSDLAQLGYWWAERVVDAQYTGVPQRRRRIFFVGHLGGSGAAPVEVLLEPEGGGGNPAPSDAAGAGAAGSVAPGADFPSVVSTIQGGGRRGHRVDAESAAGGHLIPVTFQKVVRSGERDADGNLPPEVWAHREVAATLNCGDNASESRATELIVQPLAVRGRDEGAQLEVGPEGGPYNALRAGDGGSSRQSLVAITTLGDHTHALTAEGHDASEDGTGRGTPIIGFHLTQNPISGVVMPAIETTVRRLTPLECERLQGFPDNWTATSNGKPQADSRRYQQMGNAVAVPVVEWIARRLVRVDESGAA